MIRACGRLPRRAATAERRCHGRRPASTRRDRPAALRRDAHAEVRLVDEFRRLSIEAIAATMIGLSSGPTLYAVLSDLGWSAADSRAFRFRFRARRTRRRSRPSRRSWRSSRPASGNTRPPRRMTACHASSRQGPRTDAASRSKTRKESSITSSSPGSSSGPGSWERFWSFRSAPICATGWSPRSGQTVRREP